MSQIECDRSARLSAALFVESIVPLAKARRSSGSPAYFSRGRDRHAPSYFERPEVTTMIPTSFEIARGGAPEGLIDALTAYWEAQGETELAAMGPRLKEIAAALSEEAAENTGDIDPLCYTLF